MKITIELSDPPLAEVKAFAAREGTTLPVLVGSGLRHVLAEWRPGS